MEVGSYKLPSSSLFGLRVCLYVCSVKLRFNGGVVAIVLPAANMEEILIEETDVALFQMLRLDYFEDDIYNCTQIGHNMIEIYASSQASA